MKKVLSGLSVLLGVAAFVVDIFQSKYDHEEIRQEVRADILKELEDAGLIERK